MVDTVDINVIDVQQQVAVGFDQHVIDEFRLRHFLSGRRIIGHVFNGQAPPDNILDAPDPGGSVADRLFREWNRHQVVQVAVITAITEVLAVTTDVECVEELPYFMEERLVQGRRAAEVERQPVTHNRRPFSYLAKAPPEAAPYVDPVLRRHFHEADFRQPARRVCKRAHEGPPQTQASSLYGVWSRHILCPRINPGNDSDMPG